LASDVLEMLIDVADVRLGVDRGDGGIGTYEGGGGGGATPSEIYAYFTAGSRPDAFKTSDSEIRAAVGMASADLDSQLDAILAASGGGGWDDAIAEPATYPAIGATPTAGQMLWMILQGVLERELDGTTLKVLDTDGDTAMTFTVTLNSSGYVTKVVRAS
jgi:hypothetical protein